MALTLGPSRVSAYTSSEEFEDSSREAQSKQQMEQPCAKLSLSSRAEDNNALQTYLRATWKQAAASGTCETAID